MTRGYRIRVVFEATHNLSRVMTSNPFAPHLQGRKNHQPYRSRVYQSSSILPYMECFIKKTSCDLHIFVYERSPFHVKYSKQKKSRLPIDASPAFALLLELAKNRIARLIHQIQSHHPFHGKSERPVRFLPPIPMW